MEFGNRIKQGRINKGLTQQEVADELNVSRQTISSWENEKSYPDINSLIELSNKYQISLDVLLKEDTGMKEYLEKQMVLKRIKPIGRALIALDLLLVLIMTLNVFDIIKVRGVAMLVMLTVLLFTLYPLNRFNDFELELTGRDRFPKLIAFLSGKWLWYLILATVLISIGSYFVFGVDRLSGYFTGTAAALIMLKVAVKYRKKAER
ncbi:helix-turn-helix transcriptional regulator [Lentilactobacillus sp. Marseille-Q4993]|uniref:helix-turn-helix domain-containing protein n=1 Tax=Lentilactobacillus sp. Marseille-Q4993 TaxID=3039492 RepID=UPI0024BC25ED|nr:helix-turn-helix transcriptional regulator [Lentilactobacillus sp. Marseille-Q4993]